MCQNGWNVNILSWFEYACNIEGTHTLHSPLVINNSRLVCSARRKKLSVCFLFHYGKLYRVVSVAITILESFLNGLKSKNLFRNNKTYNNFYYSGNSNDGNRIFSESWWYLLSYSCVRLCFIPVTALKNWREIFFSALLFIHFAVSGFQCGLYFSAVTSKRGT